MSENDRLRSELKAMRPKLARIKKIRQLSRVTGVHPAQVHNYLDGFGANADLMRLLLAEGSKLLAKEGEKA